METQMVDKAGAVLIARDVLAQLDALTFTYGRYCNGKVPVASLKLVDHDVGTAILPFQENVDAITRHCSVCALGAMLLSKTRLFDDFSKEVAYNHGGETVHVAFGHDAVADELDRYFDDVTIEMIDGAFEGRFYGSNGHEDFTTEELCRIYGAIRTGRAMPAGECVRFVAQNIIDNDGDFVVTPVEANDLHLLIDDGEDDDGDEDEDEDDDEDYDDEFGFIDEDDEDDGVDEDDDLINDDERPLGPT